MTRPLDLRVYLVTSGTGRQTVEAAAAAAAAGAGTIQVRAKELSTRALLELTCSVAEAVHAAYPKATVLVDDRADVAYAAMRRGAHVHGVHLGQDDLPPAAARELLGPGAVVGWTTGTVGLAQAAEDQADVIDYVGAGPFRLTPTKDSGRPALGVAGYPPIVAATSLPVVAIGSVTAGDVPALARTGIAGGCAVRAIMDAPDPGAATAALLRAWESGHGSGGERGDVR
ncbi:MAG: thiamine phosphate synthase [Micrococcales bacterium]|nr:thiamine phosphate synthase [Micrococcales bacterium]